MATTLGYDLSGRLASLTAGSFLSYAYSRLPGGDITGINDQLHPAWSSGFWYDPVGRLSSGEGSWEVEEYSYDFAGDRLGKTVDGVATTYAYLPGGNRLQSSSGSESGLYTHDGMGNLTVDRELSFTYDATGRMRKASQNGAPKGEYRFNAAGQRVSKNGDRLYLYGLGGELIGEYLSTGALVAEVVYADGLRLAEYRDEKAPPVAAPRAGAGYNLSRSSSFATEERTFIKATDTLYTRLWTDTVDPTQVTVATATLKTGSTTYTYPLTYDAGSKEWRGSYSLSGVNLTKGNFWTWTGKVTDSLGHTYAPTATVTISTGAYIKVYGTSKIVAPVVSGLSPNTGSASGGARVTVTGTGFKAGATLKFENSFATAVSFVSATTLKGTLPARAWAGKVDVRVRNTDSGEGMLPCAFSYTSASPEVRIHWYHSDHLGTPVYLTNGAGAVVWHGEQRPFGGLFLEETDPDGNGIHLTQPFRFPGQYFDAETGLHYNYFRDYDPKLGRYIEADPIGQGGEWNVFGFAGQNSIKNTDKFGQAYFAKRPLEGWPWLYAFSHNPGSLSDINNVELSHEQLFFEDGKTPSSIGFMGNGTTEEEAFSSGYRITSGKFNDCIMRYAVKLGPLPSYSVVGEPGPIEKYNCQDWAAQVRREYAILIRDPQFRKQCGLCPPETPAMNDSDLPVSF